MFLISGSVLENTVASIHQPQGHLRLWTPKVSVCGFGKLFLLCRSGSPTRRFLCREALDRFRLHFVPLTRYSLATQSFSLYFWKLFNKTLWWPANSKFQILQRSFHSFFCESIALALIKPEPKSAVHQLQTIITDASPQCTCGCFRVCIMNGPVPSP